MSRSNSGRLARRQANRRWRTVVPFALLCVACLGYLAYTFQANKTATQYTVTAAIADQHTTTSVPFAGGLPTNALVLVEARINGKGPYVFKLDTGTQFSALNHRIGDSLKPLSRAKNNAPDASPSLTSPSLTSSSSAQTPAVMVDRVEIGAAHLQRLLMNVADMPEEAPYDGILGMDIFEQFVVSIDYAQRRVSLTLPDKFAYTGRGDVFPFEFSDKGTPLIESNLGGPVTRLEVNTGQETAVKLFQEYVQNNSMKGRYPNFVEFHVGKKSADTVETLLFTHILALTLNEDIRYSYPIVAMSDHAASVSGSLGNFFLQQFTVTIDWHNQQVILEKNRLYGHPFPSNRAGFLLERTVERNQERNQDGVAISEVVDNSPASDAGLQQDDRVLTLAGHAAKTLNHFAWDALLDGDPGTKLPLTVVRDGKTLSFVLTLRDLL